VCGSPVFEGFLEGATLAFKVGPATIEKEMVARDPPLLPTRSPSARRPMSTSARRAWTAHIFRCEPRPLSFVSLPP
jgi:hypothetical protein